MSKWLNHKSENFMVNKFCIILMFDYNYLPYLGWYKLKHTSFNVTFTFRLLFFIIRNSSEKDINAFTNKNQAYELNIYLSLYLFCCVVVGRYSNCNYIQQHLNFEAAVSLVCSSLQISVLRIGAVIFYSFFVQHMRRARNWWDSSLVCFVNSSRVEDTQVDFDVKKKISSCIFWW